ncbi:MAG: M23 family metallopeptidase [Bacteroidia bacterium]|nr:M23 family metallopeptidase [Bacteroidia bacterium]
MKKALSISALLIGFSAGAYAITRSFSRSGSQSRFGATASFDPPVSPIRMRNDPLGQGHFGAPRGSRTHQGVDLVVLPGQPIYSPIAGYINRLAIPYRDDGRYSGIEILGTGAFSAYAIKIFYMEAIRIGVSIRKGEQIGLAQQISTKYSSRMIDHIHVEFMKDGQLVDPWPFFSK